MSAELIRIAAAGASALAFLPGLDDLPPASHLRVGMSLDEPHRMAVEVALSTAGGRDTESVVGRLLRWRDGVTGARVECARLSGVSPWWQVSVRWVLAGVEVRVWDHIQPDAGLVAALEAESSPESAGHVLAALMAPDEPDPVDEDDPWLHPATALAGQETIPPAVDMAGVLVASPDQSAYQVFNLAAVRADDRMVDEMAANVAPLHEFADLPAVRRLPVRRSTAERDRHDAIATAAQELARKGREHQERGWEHIRVGALAPLIDAVFPGGDAS